MWSIQVAEESVVPVGKLIKDSNSLGNKVSVKSFAAIELFFEQILSSKSPGITQMYLTQSNI